MLLFGLFQLCFQPASDATPGQTHVISRNNTLPATSLYLAAHWGLLLMWPAATWTTSQESQKCGGCAPSTHPHPPCVDQPHQTHIAKPVRRPPRPGPETWRIPCLRKGHQNPSTAAHNRNVFIPPADRWSCSGELRTKTDYSREYGLQEGSASRFHHV